MFLWFSLKENMARNICRKKSEPQHRILFIFSEKPAVFERLEKNSRVKIDFCFFRNLEKVEFRQGEICKISTFENVKRQCRIMSVKISPPISNILFFWKNFLNRLRKPLIFFALRTADLDEFRTSRSSTVRATFFLKVIFLYFLFYSLYY